MVVSVLRHCGSRGAAPARYQESELRTQQKRRSHRRAAADELRGPHTGGKAAGFLVRGAMAQRWRKTLGDDHSSLCIPCARMSHVHPHHNRLRERTAWEDIHEATEASSERSGAYWAESYEDRD